MRRQRYGSKAAVADEAPGRKSASRDTQLRLQGAFCAEVIYGHDWVEDAELHETIKQYEFDDSDVARRDRAWLRYYGTSHGRGRTRYA